MKDIGVNEKASLKSVSKTKVFKTNVLGNKKMIFGKFRHLHFVGIGGAGMSGMAQALAELGYRVTGSDMAPTDVTQALQRSGINVFEGHMPNNIEDAHVVVISSAVQSNNPEVVEAKRLNIPVIKRAEMLGELMRLKSSIGIAGSHGKTTTTAICGRIIADADLEPTIIVGGRFTDTAIGAAVGSGEYMVVEADEFDRSFHSMYPSMAVATNLDLDHLDCYRDLNDLKEAFTIYLNRTPFYGQVILNGDDSNLADITIDLKRPVITFGLGEKCDYRACDLKSDENGCEFSMYERGQLLGKLRFPIPGTHNVMNSLCAAAIALEIDIPFDTIAESLANFPGVLRRMEFKGEVNGRVVYDDYAHHPTEVRCSLETAKTFNRPVCVIFQPHLFSRTRDFASDFASALGVVDRVVVVDIYPAREEPIDGVTSKLITDSAAKQGIKSIKYIGDTDAAIKYVVSGSPDNELIMTVGAGNVFHLVEPILNGLKEMKDSKS